MNNVEKFKQKYNLKKLNDNESVVDNIISMLKNKVGGNYSYTENHQDYGYENVIDFINTLDEPLTIKQKTELVIRAESQNLKFNYIRVLDRIGINIDTKIVSEIIREYQKYNVVFDRFSVKNTTSKPYSTFFTHTGLTRFFNEMKYHNKGGAMLDKLICMFYTEYKDKFGMRMDYDDYTPILAQYGLLKEDYFKNSSFYRSSVNSIPYNEITPKYLRTIMEGVNKNGSYIIKKEQLSKNYTDMDYINELVNIERGASMWNIEILFDVSLLRDKDIILSLVRNKILDTNRLINLLYEGNDKEKLSDDSIDIINYLIDNECFDVLNAVYYKFINVLTPYSINKIMNCETKHYHKLFYICHNTLKRDIMEVVYDTFGNDILNDKDIDFSHLMDCIGKTEKFSESMVNMIVTNFKSNVFWNMRHMNIENSHAIILKDPLYFLSDDGFLCLPDRLHTIDLYEKIMKVEPRAFNLMRLEVIEENFKG